MWPSVIVQLFEMILFFVEFLDVFREENGKRRDGGEIGRQRIAGRKVGGGETGEGAVELNRHTVIILI